MPHGSDAGKPEGPAGHLSAVQSWLCPHGKPGQRPSTICYVEWLSLFYQTLATSLNPGPLCWSILVGQRLPKTLYLRAPPSMASLVGTTRPGLVHIAPASENEVCSHWSQRYLQETGDSLGVPMPAFLSISLPPPRRSQLL